MVKIFDKILIRLGLTRKSEIKSEPTPSKKKQVRKPKRRKHENNTNIYFYYTQYDRLYFKTPSGRSPLKITARESVRIVEFEFVAVSIFPRFFESTNSYDAL